MSSFILFYTFGHRRYQRHFCTTSSMGSYGTKARDYKLTQNTSTDESTANTTTRFDIRQLMQPQPTVD
ncbi:uncharacterized protein BdWA1_003700 [Babesia duncani]|uniref:Uncharacterized protein n=1 Tax=Babesia duncani TaxID=323732 RepID=A0AAD9PHM2_9APIC|nr:hypothetical protein BdWA1_003700 [Babesia duncani]